VVEKVFADQIRSKRLKKGQMFQAPRQKKDFDAFAGTELGKRYKDAKPGQWLER
jgi:hypothetical protein